MHTPTILTPKFLGRHVILEVYDCWPRKLRDAAAIESVLRKSANDIGATVLSANFRSFDGEGVTGVLVLAESHITIHTWPEYGYAAVDIFTCGACDPRAGIPVITDHFNSTNYKTFDFLRGEISSD